MPKLLQINSTANRGSTGRIAEQIGLAAMAQGWQSYIAYGRSGGESASELIKIGSRWDFYAHALFTRLTDRHGLASTRATKELIEKIKEINPDIIHLHNIHGYYINYKVLFEYLNSIDTPVVWTLHDCWTFTGHCAYFDSINCDKWQQQCFDCKLIQHYPSSWMIDSSNKNFNLKKQLFQNCRRLVLVPVSYWLQDLLSKSYLKNCECSVIHNGIDVEVFQPYNEEKRENNNAFVLVGVAMPWSERKGLFDFIKLREVLPLQEYKIVLVGVTDQQMSTLPDGIVGIKRTHNAAELAQIYSEADIFINPTYSDNFPTTNLEALACGTPVITYRTGGSPESITPQTGIVVEQGNIDALVDAIKRIKQRGKAAYSSACRAYAEEHFDKDKCFGEYIDLYNEILNNNH